MKHINLQLQEAQWTLRNINTNTHIPWHIIIELLLKLKYKEKIPKAARKQKKVHNIEEITNVNYSHFSCEMKEAKRQENRILKGLKDNNSLPIFLYPIKRSLKNEDKIKTFRDKQKLTEFIIRRNWTNFTNLKKCYRDLFMLKRNDMKWRLKMFWKERRTLEMINLKDFFLV